MLKELPGVKKVQSLDILSWRYAALFCLENLRKLLLGLMKDIKGIQDKN